MNLGARLKQRRLELGMTLKDVASKLSVTMATYQRYETNKIKTLKYKTIIELAEALQTTPTYIMGWENKQSASTNTESGETDPLDSEIIEAFRLLSPEYKRIALAQIKAMLEVE
ncbi:MAG: helix-turn-helix transcriptional regulator [Clostridiales bacterium]|jgi:transcriptional regulator with XRE-family HTH domain|nr:helix-turn-helix transcriptional regulator [Clostridiales bacterium]